MAYNWNGIMELFSGKYRPSWSSVCGGSDVKGIMELADAKYKPTPDSHGICSDSDIAALSRYMVRGDGSREGITDTDLYYPRVVLNDEEMCCAGVNCLSCDTLLWDNGKTPKKIRAVVSGVDWQTSGCGQYDPNGDFILTQDTVAHNCFWSSGTSQLPLYYVYEAFYPVRCSLSETTTSSCFHIFDSTHWYFITCASPCAQDGLTYYNQPHLGACCSGLIIGGCWLYSQEVTHQAATFGGQAVISWPI
jgi:hypothetical protein